MFKSNGESEFKKKVEAGGETIATIVGNVADQIAKIDHKIGEQVDTAIVRARKAGREDIVKWQSK